MSQSRTTQNEQPRFEFDERGLYTTTYLDVYGSAQNNQRVELIIPVCIGYKEISPGIYDYKLDARTSTLISELKDANKNFKLYLAPRNNDASLIEAFKKANESMLSDIPADRVFLSTDWRNEANWLAAEKANNEFFSDPDRLETLKKQIENDNNAFVKRRAQVKSIDASEGTVHVRNEAIDCLSWMQKTSIEKASDDMTNLKCIRFVLHESFSNAMRHVYQHSAKMGYDPSSLFFVEFKKVLKVSKVNRLAAEGSRQQDEKQSSPMLSVSSEITKDDLKDIAAMVVIKGGNADTALDFFHAGLKRIHTSKVSVNSSAFFGGSPSRNEKFMSPSSSPTSSPSMPPQIGFGGSNQ